MFSQSLDCSEYATWRLRPYVKINDLPPMMDYVACQFDASDPQKSAPPKLIAEIAARYPNAINLGQQFREGLVDGTTLTAAEKFETIKSAKLYVGVDCELSHFAGTTNSLCAVVHTTAQRPHFCYPCMSQYRFFTCIEDFDSLDFQNDRFQMVFDAFKQRQGRTVIEVGNRQLDGVETTELFARMSNLVCTFNGDLLAIERARQATATFNNVMTFHGSPIEYIARLSVPMDLLYFGAESEHEHNMLIYAWARKKFSGRSMILIEDIDQEPNTRIIQYALRDGFQITHKKDFAFLMRFGFLKLKH